MLKLLRLPLQFFSADPGGGNGDPAPEQTGGQEPPGFDPQQQGTGDPQPPEEKMLPQSDVNNLIAKETKKTQEKLLKQLGIEDFDSAKDGLAKFREWQESQKTEQEKQAELLKNLETEKGTLSEENSFLKAQLSAVKAGVKADSVEDVVTLAKNLVNDDVDMDTAIKSVLEKYPHFGQEQQGPGGKEKPTFTTGQHQTQNQTELEKWLSAFK